MSAGLLGGVTAGLGGLGAYSGASQLSQTLIGEAIRAWRLARAFSIGNPDTMGDPRKPLEERLVHLTNNQRPWAITSASSFAAAGILIIFNLILANNSAPLLIVASVFVISGFAFLAVVVRKHSSRN